MRKETDMNDFEHDDAARDDGASSGHALRAFVLGAAAGAVFALLYAPASGATTRRYLGRQARDGRRRANVAFQKGVEVMEQGRERLSSAVAEGRSHWNNLKTQAEGAVDEGRGAASRIVEHARQAAGEVEEGINKVSASVRGESAH
jgi:gas vesicle protein